MQKSRYCIILGDSTLSQPYWVSLSLSLSKSERDEYRSNHILFINTPTSLWPISAANDERTQTVVCPLLGVPAHSSHSFCWSMLQCSVTRVSSSEKHCWALRYLLHLFNWLKIEKVSHLCSFSYASIERLDWDFEELSNCCAYCKNGVN